jgi:hypothetical protein
LREVEKERQFFLPEVQETEDEGDTGRDQDDGPSSEQVTNSARSGLGSILEVTSELDIDRNGVVDAKQGSGRIGNTEVEH